MVISADTSFLFSLFGNDVNTPKAIARVKSLEHSITITALGEYELGNALRFSEFRKAISPGKADEYWSEYQTDLAAGRIVVSRCNLADLVAEANRISTKHTLAGGHRSFDILHIAGANLLGAEAFLTYDRNQRKLADLEGYR